MSVEDAEEFVVESFAARTVAAVEIVAELENWIFDEAFSSEQLAAAQ